MISSHVTLKIQQYLRICYSDSTISVLVFKHMMSGHFTVYLSSSNETLYRNHNFLYRTLESLLMESDTFVLSLEVVIPRSPAYHRYTTPKTMRSHLSARTNHIDLFLDDPCVVDESESSDWPSADMDIWKSWS